jgi:hypothetical protein
MMTRTHRRSVTTKRWLLAGLLATMAAATAVTTITPSGQAATSAAADTWRGQLVSVTPLRTLPGKAAVTTELTSDGFSAASARYGVRAYRLVYRTVDASGRPTTASGLLALPISGERVLPVVSFNHGTEASRSDAPSVQPSGFDPAPAYTYASAGFATVEPDYLGLGTGPGPHPWMDVPSETVTTVDMLRAARGYLAGHGRALRHDVMVTGFSQGASAALGLARALQAGADPWFRLGALAPISGAYDFQGAEIPALLNGDLVRLNPVPGLGSKYTVLYTAYTFIGFNRVHPIAGLPAKIFKTPYASTLPRLFDGDHTDQQVFNGTPATLDELLTPYGFELLRHPAGGLLAAFRSADSVCSGWTPTAPARLYMADGDEQAVNANTWHCQGAFAAHGATVPVVDLGTPDNQDSRHYGSNAAGTAQIVRWFTTLAR